MPLNVYGLLGYHTSAIALVFVWYLDPPYIDVVGLVRALATAYMAPDVIIGVMVWLDVAADPLPIDLQI